VSIHRALGIQGAADASIAAVVRDVREAMKLPPTCDAASVLACYNAGRRAADAMRTVVDPWASTSRPGAGGNLTLSTVTY